MKIKLTFILALALCLILTATACAGPKLAPAPEPISTMHTDAVKATQTPEQTIEPASTQTLEPTELGLWDCLRKECFASVDDYSYSDLIDALYAEDGEAEISAKMDELGFSTIYDYLFYRIQEEKRAIYAEQATPEPTKSVDNMSHYERAYYYATPEQRKRLENIKKPWGDGVYEYTRQIREIMGEIEENLPHLTLEQARAICEEAKTLTGTEEDAIGYIAERFLEIAGAPDAVGGSGMIGYYFFIDDDGVEAIGFFGRLVSYGNEATKETETLWP